MRYIFMLVLTLTSSFALAESDVFPQFTTRPVIADFLPTPSNTYYCSPTGDNDTGDGSIGNPWADLQGAQGTVAAGDLIYFRAGYYPLYDVVNGNYSVNRVTTSGTADDPIVITNYPGEIMRYSSTDTTWCLSLCGDHQKLIGTMVDGAYGIQIHGGISFHEADSVQISNVEFSGGCLNHPASNNPAMVSQPYTGYTADGAVISHNKFRDSAYVIPAQFMGCIRLFDTSNITIEYNLFEDNAELDFRVGCILFKDATADAIVRHNRFISSVVGVAYSTQGDAFEGLDVYGNLFYDVNNPFVFLNDLGNADEINVYNNVALAIPADGYFFHYLNTDNQDWTEHGDYYNNIIDGQALEAWSHEYSDDLRNLPDYWDYNLYYDAADTNTPSGWTLPAAYYTNAIISADAVTFNFNSKTATVEDDYAGLEQGRNGDNIGGFVFTAGRSDHFPQSDTRPTPGDFITTPSDTFYCSPTGDNDTGDGSFDSPWIDFIGATGNCGPGDLIYFRGGTYPSYDRVNFSRSQNNLTDNGTEANPIVITNYPGEIVLYDDTDTIWCLTLGGDHQKLIGTMVDGDYGIQITGGISFHEVDHAQVSNVEFIHGTSNGGDINPAMLSDPLPHDNQGLIVSHNWFHDSAWVIPEHRVGPLRFFVQSNTVVEYNLFEDNTEVYRPAGCVFFKDRADDPIVRYNTFVNCLSGVSYSGQGDHFEGLECYGNLFYDVDYPFVFTNDLGDNDEINVFNNVVLSIPTGGAFMYYMNTDNQDWTEHGDYYDNVIDGPAFTLHDHDDSDDSKNIPDYFGHNLWYRASDRNTPSGWTLRTGYYTGAVTGNSAVTYNSTTRTATVADDYAGIDEGRYGGTIGGFIFSDPSPSLTVTATRGTGTVTVTTTGRTGEVQYQVAESGETVHHIVADADSVTLPAGSGRLDIRVIDSTGSKRNHVDAE